MSIVNFQLVRNAMGKLVLIDQRGEQHEGVNPVRAYPISAPDDGVSLVGADGHEVAWIDRLSQVPEQIRALIEEDLVARDFMPTIHRILAVSTFSTPSRWTVDTDRGQTEFTLPTEEHIRRLPQGRLLIESSAGLHFAVADRFALDKGSRKFLDRFL